MKKLKTTIVLMYHGIVTHSASIPSDREVGAELYDLAADKFQEQINFLSEQGFEIGRVSGAENVPPDVVLTFDDGEENNIQNALPVLARHKFPAYFFVTVNRIGKKGYMNWEQLKELRDANMIIGSHSLNHVVLTELKDTQLEREMIESKDILERQLKINIDDFSVPRGFCNARILKVGQDAGYKRIFVSESVPQGTGAAIPRLAVKSSWSLRRFEQALYGKVPLEEAGINFFKTAAKKLLGSSGYNAMRSGILKGSARKR